MVFTVTVLYLLIKNMLNEKISLLWLFGSLVVFIISIFPSKLDELAHAIGIDYPPSLLFLLSILLLLFICLYHSVQISILNQQIKELTQYISIEEKVNKNDFNLGG
jgi:hypothetical protein